MRRRAPAQPRSRERAGVHARLVVDDNEDAAELLARRCAAGARGRSVGARRPAALQSRASSRPSIALLDIGLPAMDGYELARRLRALPAPANLRLIAVTGYGQARDRTRPSRPASTNTWSSPSTWLCSKACCREPRPAAHGSGANVATLPAAASTAAATAGQGHAERRRCSRARRRCRSAARIAAAPRPRRGRAEAG